MNRNFSYINLIASEVPLPPMEAPELPHLYPDEEIELDVSDFQNIITHGDTSTLLDTFYINEGARDTVVIDVRTPEEHEECEATPTLLSEMGTTFFNISVGNLTHMNRTYLENNFGIKRH
jgi:hypothetical protein